MYSYISVRRKLLLITMKIVSRNKSCTLVLYGQASKRIRWMPRQLEAMKDVGACDKLRGGGKQPLIRRFPNGGTHPSQGGYHALNS